MALVLTVAALGLTTSLGGGPYFDLHSADSLTLVRRGWLPENAGATASAELRVEMVRNEAESGQLVVVVRSYANQGAKGITWEVSPLLDVSSSTRTKSTTHLAAECTLDCRCCSKTRLETPRL